LTDRGSQPPQFEGLPFREILETDPDRGVALFDEDARIVYQNLAARSQLHDPDGQLVASVQSAVSAYRDRLDRIESSPPPGEILLSAGSGRPFRATLSLLPRAGSRWFLVRVSPPGLFAEPNVRRLQTRFRLTLREAQVAVDVARGLTNAEVGGHLGITEKTVKNALMAVFAKCEVRNRVELALRAHDAPIGPGATPA
jgi:DNA-binding CsgD family transcriptional regulator